ncbi:hypothetical protein [Pseudomonas citronellolis]|uniref:hypothetical protein n=1 Tax=Pseudomonas citronellolis TaxID=53408 RepID=UPI00078CC6E8|nr:hypothetical protein [Pseudomonas citronellolis]AMO73852.1 hypothetical protein PcP3B5_03400 [Pseudomonas citronellolis]
MLGGLPLNAAALGILWAVGSEPGEPGEPGVVQPPKPPGLGVPTSGYAFRWWVSVLIGGEQVAANLTGRMQIDREEGAAGVATFSLYYPPGESVPTDLGGDAVAIDFLSETGGVTTSARRYTGVAVEPRWDAVNRVMEITCSDKLQQRIEQMQIAEIDALIGGAWSSDVFEAIEGRSRFDYATERLSTVPAALDIGVDGQMHVTSWYAQAPAFVFAEGSTLYQSVSVELAQAQSATNRVELSVDYRYSRLWERHDSYSWEHPGTGGLGGVGGFCHWRPDSSDLPDVGMIEQATSSAGMKMLTGAVYNKLPPSSGDPCGTGQGWINKFPNLVLATTWTGGRRWVQPITERYSVLVGTLVGLQGASEVQVIARQNAAFEIEDKRSEAWENDDFNTGEPGAIDLVDDLRRETAFSCTLQRAAVTVIGAHRGTTVSWQVPTPMGIGCDLVHTLELRDQVKARGKCRRIVDELDFSAGTAITTLSIAVMRGGGSSDVLSPPAKPDVDVAEVDFTHDPLPTQLGMRNESPIYNDELDGFAGNYDNRDDDINPNLEEFPRRMTITAPEIEAGLRDEREVPVAVTYQVGIPDDLLEL